MLRIYKLLIHFVLFLYLLLNIRCGIVSKTADQRLLQGSNDLQGNKIPMRSWIVPTSQIFPIVVKVTRTSFPRSKIHENSQKKRLHFWYLDSEQGDVLIIMDVTSQDSISTLNLYKPRYGVSQPLFIKDPIPLKHFLENLDRRIKTLGISEVSTRIDIK